jgi:hypothetical protein
VDVVYGAGEGEGEGVGEGYHCSGGGGLDEVLYYVSTCSTRNFLVRAIWRISQIDMEIEPGECQVKWDI